MNNPIDEAIDNPWSGKYGVYTTREILAMAAQLNDFASETDSEQEYEELTAEAEAMRKFTGHRVI